MKISCIELKDYNQFQNLTLYFTYPKGHEKEGQALDKICFLGQSGTGKTSLLNACRAILRATFKPSHDGTLRATINKAYQKYNIKNIVITSYFKEILIKATLSEKRPTSIGSTRRTLYEKTAWCLKCDIVKLSTFFDRLQNGTVRESIPSSTFQKQQK